MRIMSFFKTYFVSTAKKYFSLFTDMYLLIWEAKRSAKHELKRLGMTVSYASQFVYTQFQRCQSSGAMFLLNVQALPFNLTRNYVDHFQP